MKRDFISVFRESFKGIELVDLATQSRKKILLDKKSKELLNRYISEFKKEKITKELFSHRLSVLTGMKKNEANQFCNSLMAGNISAFGGNL